MFVVSVMAMVPPVWAVTESPSVPPMISVAFAEETAALAGLFAPSMIARPATRLKTADGALTPQELASVSILPTTALALLL